MTLPPNVRNGDPDTSRRAAALNFAGRRGQIIAALQATRRPLDAHELAAWVNAQPGVKPTVSGHAAKRAGELVAAGVLDVAGTHRNPDGLTVTVWALAHDQEARP